MNPLVVVSNRLPVSVSRNPDGTFAYNHAHGGLPTAMSSLDIESGYIWIGWPGIASDDLTDADKQEITERLSKDYKCIPVFLTAEHIADFYEGYSNDTLWPLFHYFPSYATFQSRYWHSYQEVNQLYCEAIQQHAVPDSMIWIHDYHLLLLPALVRTVLPEASIGFFLHIPFPSYEIFRQIPERSELMRGMLGADLIGFHIYDYARHFISSASRLAGADAHNGTLEYDGRAIRVDTYPIGIDYDRFVTQLRSTDSKRELAALKESMGDQKVIVAVDRLDYSKGILERLRGFELFLQQHPEYVGKVTLQMIASPSRTEVQAYKQLRDDVDQLVSRINGTFGTFHWTPIVYMFQNFGFDKIVPLYNFADVALITPMRDGMNLVAKEYIASKGKKAGVLILSEMAGAADELLDAIQVNPNNTQLLADSIHQALTMPKNEQCERLARMQKRIAEYSVQRWGNDFVTDLTTSAAEHKQHIQKRINRQETDTLLHDFCNASSRLLLLDYDGTLRTFTTNIGDRAAAPSDDLLDLIDRLSKLPDTKVVVTSGRTKEALGGWFAHMPKVSLVAEHGAWIRDHNQWEQNAQPHDLTEVTEIMERYALKTAGAVVDQKQFSTVWHYRRVNPELAFVRNAELRHDLRASTAGTDIDVYDGRKIIEVKPKALHKGVIAREFTDRYPSDFIFAAGDDYTDEQMFEALPSHAYSVKVGSGATAARFQVSRTAKMISLLEALVKEES